MTHDSALLASCVTVCLSRIECATNALPSPSELATPLEGGSELFLHSTPSMTSGMQGINLFARAHLSDVAIAQVEIRELNQ